MLAAKQVEQFYMQRIFFSYCIIILKIPLVILIANSIGRTQCALVNIKIFVCKSTCLVFKNMCLI